MTMEPRLVLLCSEELLEPPEKDKEKMESGMEGQHSQVLMEKFKMKLGIWEEKCEELGLKRILRFPWNNLDFLGHEKNLPV